MNGLSDIDSRAAMRLAEYRIHGGSRHRVGTLMGRILDDNFGVIALLHGQAWRGAKRTQRLEGDAD
ncbi:hypothetical protein RTE01_40000 [Raoultella terrigena]|nr:hypothetical protein RTE01_40000 [Raoultella terrigena]